MNSFIVQDDTLELVFENCECINVSIGAIESMYMTTRGKRFAFDKLSKTMMQCEEVESFEIKLNLYDKSYFNHSTPGQMLTHALTESVLTDRNLCIERLKTCNDITHVYINGVCYQMPWLTKEDKPFTNELQTNKEEYTDGKHFITFTIKAKEAINEL